jgi:hypothetical protein
MTKKIRIVSGFATPNDVANELGVSKTELKTIDDLLNKPVGKKAPHSRSGRFVTRKAATKKMRTGKRPSGPASKTIWQVVKASKKNARRRVR